MAAVKAPEDWQATVSAGPAEHQIHYACPGCRRPQMIHVQSPPWCDENGQPAAELATRLWCHACQRGTDCVLTDG